MQPKSKIKGIRLFDRQKSAGTKAVRVSTDWSSFFSVFSR